MSFSHSTQLHRIASLLASGLNAAQVSSIVGVSPSRISQVKSSPEFDIIYKEYQNAEEEKNVEEVATSAKYLAAEHALINQVLALAPSAELRDVTAALRVVSDRQERAAARKNPIHASTIVHNNIISLTLPAHALPELTISPSNEVLAIASQNLAPLTSEGVTNLFSSLKENKNVPGRIPPLTEEASREAPIEINSYERVA